MNSLTRALLVMLCLAMMIGLPFLAPAEGAPLAAWESFDLSSETFGPLRVGMPAGELREVLGEWEQGSEPAVWGADGLEHWSVVYAPQGIAIGLARTPGNEGSASVYSIEALGPAEWKTARGLKIGDPAELMKELYAEALNPEWDLDASQWLLIGSPYGGVLAGLKDGTVVSLFFGAMAE